MKVLAIEISSAQGSIAVARDGALVGERRFGCARGRGAEVFDALRDTRPLWKNADVVAVGIGPGSYNGLRVACSLATSLAMAGTGEIRVSPSPCLLPNDAPHYLVYGDARGGRAYRAEVRQRRLIGDISLVEHAEVASSRHPNIPSFRVGAVPGGETLPELAPDAAILALLATDLATVSGYAVEPIYLKPPHITTPRKGTT